MFIKFDGKGLNLYCDWCDIIFHSIFSQHTKKQSELIESNLMNCGVLKHFLMSYNVQQIL